MGCCKKKKVKGRNSKAASSLAPGDKYHKNPLGGHRHGTPSTTSPETHTISNNQTASANNNHPFSHNGIPPPIPSASSGAAEHLEPQHHQQFSDNLIQTSSYHFYPSNSVGSASVSSSSHHLNNYYNHNQQHPSPFLHQQQPPYLYKSNHSSSGGSCSGNGSHIIIDGSNGAGSVVEGRINKYFYYYNGHYYPTTTTGEEEEHPDQIFTITATTSGSGTTKQVTMGRVGDDMYQPGSPASVGKRGTSSVSAGGLFKSKSSSIPVMSGSPQPHHRGFRDTFISSMSPPVQVHSAESSPLHRSASAATANSSERYSVSGNGSSVASGTNKQENKKWSFGGLFRRNKKSGGTTGSNNNSIVLENGGGTGVSSTNNSHFNSPAKVNNNYGSGSPIILPTRSGSTYSPARPASSVGFVSIDPTAGQAENFHRQSALVSSSTSKFVNAESQTRTKGKLSESDISTCDSEFELELPHHTDNPPEPAPQENKGYKQNFLVRRLSRRKEKAAAKKAAAAAASTSPQVSSTLSPKTTASGSNHHNSSHQHLGGGFDVPQMKRRVGSSPDSLNNSSEPWPSWETTKKPQSQLQVLQQQHRLLNNYSSNGSLSVSQEGYNSNNNSSNNHSGKSTRAAAREAVKARAIARRESFLRDSSSSDDDTEERSQRSSLQGSFSSLNSRNCRQKAFNMQQAQFQQQRHLFPANSGQAGAGVTCASPSSPMPVPLDYRSLSGSNVANGMSPNMNRRLMMMGAPGSPKWETRVIYQQDGTASESNQQGMVRLPRKERMSSGTSNPHQMSQNNGDQQSFIMATEMISEDQHVVTAGLKVPFLPVQNQQHQQHHQNQDQQGLRNGQLMFPDDPIQYANVANGMRGRSCTPYMGYNNGATGAGVIHHASPTPPPPPPPRRDFTRATSNNFYRPVSCSYLDSYANQIQMNEHHLRQQSPMIFNGNYIYTPSAQQHHQYQGQQQPEVVMNGFASHSLHNSDGSVVATGIARSSPRHFGHGSGSTPAANSNQADVDGARHPPLIRSPSEPPIIRGEQTRISSPVKRMISSPMSNGSNGESQLMNGSGKSSPGKNVITSKLGFPVRRLQEASKLSIGPQTPVHLRASEFWRKKENEVGSPSPVGGTSGAISGSQQKKYLNRIRSADSSPLPVPKMRKSPGGVAASNESISSLSSFSENAASPGPPKNSSSPLNPKLQSAQSVMKATPSRAQISKTPNPQQLTYGNNSKDKENNNTQQQSAVERLKVRIPSAPDGIKSTSNSANPLLPNTSNGIVAGNGSSKNSDSNPIRGLIELNNGKTPGKNLEDALNELEDMYKSLRLSDEDLLDRAERRDLPIPHQELRDAPLIPIPQAYQRFEQLGSVESLGTGSGSGTNYGGSGGEGQQPQRVRAPSVRRSARPDTVSDDMANRRLAYPDDKPLDPRVVVSKTGSYLARSQAFSPCTSPCPLDTAQQKQQHAITLALLGEEEPDVTLDDVSFRNYKRANAIRIIDPQPLFGIPLGPITAAAATDYLHTKPTENYRPIFGNLKTPDVVNDDIAFRNLRKDLGQEAGLPGKDWTPRLFSPNRETAFNYPKVKDTKKLRAIRSLSANITHMLPNTNSGTRDSPTKGFLQQHHQPSHQVRFDNAIGKWNSFSDLHRRASTGSPGRASSYLHPSWVEQIEKVQTSTETLTDHRNSGGVSRLATAILDPPEHWERKFPKKTVELTPDIYDPSKPRRPWTDIIFESFEKEKEKEMERIAAEAAAAASGNKTDGAANKTEGRSEQEGDEFSVDDDVFIEEACKSDVVREEVKISGNRSKDNDPERKSLEHGAIPNMESCSAASVETSRPSRIPNGMQDRPLPLLSGQKTRRGSWVEPSRSNSSSAAFHFSQCASDTTQSSTASPINTQQQDKRRKSWSDLPKDIDSFSSSSTPEAIMLSGSSCSASSTKKLFNPLPPPKKIRQINLEAFNNNSNGGSNANNAATVTSSQTQVGHMKSNDLSLANGLNNIIGQSRQVQGDYTEGKSGAASHKSDKVKSSSGKCEEDELNELMDQLLKDADACGQSILDDTSGERREDLATASNMKMNESSGRKEREMGADKGKSLPMDRTPPKASVNPHGKEMKMDGDTSSYKPTCKQDLSCAIVGIIPKHQSPPGTSAVEGEQGPTDRSNRKVQQQQTQPISCKQQINSPRNPGSAMESKSTPPTSRPAKDKNDSTSAANKLLKTNNSDENGSAVTVPKERNPLRSPIAEEHKNKNKVAGSGEVSSIEDLIESINESLPELEASCTGGGKRIGDSTSSSHSPDMKPHGSSSTSGSPASSVPSPSPGSPVPPVLSVSVLEKDVTREEGRDGDSSGQTDPMSRCSAFPVPAKRHHFPVKHISDEESLYENLPAALMMATKGKDCFPGNNNEKEGTAVAVYESESSANMDVSYQDNKPLREDNIRSKKEQCEPRPGVNGQLPLGQRGLHDGNNDDFEDNEEEDAQFSSSHQPSSLSSNDSSDVSASGGVTSSSPRENENRHLIKEQEDYQPRQKKNDNSSSANNNNNERDQVEQTSSSTSSTSQPFPSSLPFDDNKTSSVVSPFTIDNSSAFTTNQNNNPSTRPMATNSNSNTSSASSSRETLLRKKSTEGSLRAHPCEHNYNDRSKCKHCQKGDYSLSSQQNCLINLSQQDRQLAREKKLPQPYISGRRECGNDGPLYKTKERETFIGKDVSSSSSSPSSSAADEIATDRQNHEERKESQQQQPVARSKTTCLVAPAFSHATKKSTTSTTLASSITTEASATESGGMNFLRNNFPFFRSSTSRSRSQSVISDVSRSSETGDSKKERDKSYRRKSHLNRAFTDEPVPDNKYPYDLCPKSGSQDASSLESSAVEDSRPNHKPSVKLHPTIPSVLTVNKSETNPAANSSISRTNSYSHNESLPSPVPTNSHKSSPVVKKDSFSDAEGVSFIKKMLQKESDKDRAAAAAAAGNTSTLTKQNLQNGTSPSVINGNGYAVKKSPSAGNQSYWSKFSSSQSAFLRKLFDKPKVSESPGNLNSSGLAKASSSIHCGPTTQDNRMEENGSMEKENGEPLQGFSVAQKASYFMKLEHEQRFSKWRKNSVDLGIISTVSTPTYCEQSGDISRLNTNGGKSGAGEVTSKSKYLTRPVTPSDESQLGSHVNTSESLKRQIEFGSLPRIWRNDFQSFENNATDPSAKINSDSNPSAIPKSSCTDYDDKHKLQPIPSTINKFNEISTRDMDPISPYTIDPSTQPVKAFSLTRSNRHTGNTEKSHQSNLGSYPVYHSASAIINPTGTAAPSSSGSGNHSSHTGITKPSIKYCKNAGNAYSSSSSSISESQKYLPHHSAAQNGVYNGDGLTVYESYINGITPEERRRGSSSDLELSGAGNGSPVMFRSDKVKSLFIPKNKYHCDPENLSEDGEVSSGGQEVAEIICRSYENSPVFRKKNWRAQKQTQSNFTKEIWRRCGNYENWNNRSQPQTERQRHQPQHPVPQSFTATTNVIEVSNIPPSSLQSVAASPPPATSNLLQILTVLSSSNDELNEPKTKRRHQSSREKVSRTSSRADSIPPIHPNHPLVQPRASTAISNCYNKSGKHSTPNNHRHTMPPTPIADSDEVFVKVPHPADEAFQSFFCSVKSYSQVTHYPPENGVIAASVDNQQNRNGYAAEANGIENGESTDTLDISAVQRESDLLVMKKNVPTCKRKSTGSKYKNPLRALAARIDFRQQGYTQTQTNSVHCGSDVDVST